MYENQWCVLSPVTQPAGYLDEVVNECTMEYPLLLRVSGDLLLFLEEFGAIYRCSGVCIRSLNTAGSYCASVLSRWPPLEFEGCRGVMLLKWICQQLNMVIKLPQMHQHHCDWFCGVIFSINVSDLSACNDMMLFFHRVNIGSLFIFN